MDINTKIDENRRRHSTASQSYQELANSLEIESLWPDIF